MFQDPAAWTTTGIFLAALILVRRYHSLLKARNPESLRHFTGGLSLLALSALARLFHTEGMFGQIPFISEPIFFDLAYWIGIIAGGSMVVNGASEWLPAAQRRLRHRAERLERSDLLRRVQQLVGVESRIDMVLTNTLMYMKDHADFTCGAVFRLSPVCSSIELTATTPDFPIAHDTLGEAVETGFAGCRHEEKIVDLEHCLASCLPTQLSRPSAVIPVEVGRRTVSCFMLWKQDGMIEAEDRQNLQLAADIVAHKIDRDQLHSARQADKRRADWFVALENAVTTADGAARKVAALARGLAEVMPFDSMAVTFVPGSGSRTVRYSVGSGGNVLMEKSVEAPLPTALSVPAFYAGQTVVFGNLTSNRQPDYREIITASPVCSLISVPMRVQGDSMVVLTLASDQRDAYGRTNQRVLELLRPMVAMTVLSDLLDLNSRLEVTRFEKLNRLPLISAEKDSVPDMAASIVCMVAEEIGADVVRWATVDPAGMFLESRALVSTPGRTASVPANGQMILALMPLHEEAVRTGRMTMGLVRGDHDLTAMEAHQVFNDDVRQMLVVPLLHEGRAVGVVTAAVLGNRPPAFGAASQRVYLETLALMAAPLLARATGQREKVETNRLNRVARATESWNWSQELEQSETPAEMIPSTR